MNAETDDNILETMLGSEPTTEMERILYLPIDDRQPNDDLDELVDKYTAPLRREDAGEDAELLPAQALALDVLREHGGLLANIGVGHGKTLIGLLAPKIVGVGPYDTIYLHPAGTRESLHAEVEKQHENFKIETKIHAMSYAELSDERFGGYPALERRDPKLIIADEAHYVRDESAGRTRRLKRWFRNSPNTLFIAMSGTLTNSSIEEFSHLAKWALGDKSPVPRTWTGQDAWQRCLDVDDSQNVARHYHWRKMQPLYEAFADTEGGKPRELPDIPYRERKEKLRDAFMRRFSTAPGVVRTSKASVGASIRIRPITDTELAVPDAIREAVRGVEHEYMLPGGTEIDDPLAKGRAKRQLACGFYYRWDWPDDEPDREWLHARREWKSQITRIIRYGPADLDTPALVRNAVERGEYSHDEELMDAWFEWQEHKDKDPPPKETVWVDDYFIDDVERRVREASTPPLVWYQWRAVAERLDERGLDVYWPGEARSPEEADGDEAIVVSIASAQEGNNLQQFGSNLVLTPPSSGDRWEQLLGRTHRQGQQRDEVVAGIYAHVPIFRRSIREARTDAQYVWRTQNQRQKLLIADWETTLWRS